MLLLGLELVGNVESDSGRLSSVSEPILRVRTGNMSVGKVM